MHKTSPLMTVQGPIFTKGNCITEEIVWEEQNIMNVNYGKRHFILVDPMKVIISNLVQLKYQEYWQVPSSDPPHCEFLWGPRAHTKTTNMKVLEFLSKINGTTPSDFPCHYEEALRDEEQRMRVTAATMAGTTSKSSEDHVQQFLPPPSEA
ncbi:hypothetical protein mRhiFer1_007956 [Rhinolophus ferrumequinum]|uniref:MAGE domain-containing protein n=1 Tax=Rhinolophus ferrumequinum TaxID=59479 RepID=A0A7J8AW96_RHIFE|nr:hypothetical protein mRhiFer1_007956 [Rhinolophus ferrumequinum]